MTDDQTKEKAALAWQVFNAIDVAEPEGLTRVWVNQYPGTVEWESPEGVDRITVDAGVMSSVLNLVCFHLGVSCVKVERATVRFPVDGPLEAELSVRGAV